MTSSLQDLLDSFLNGESAPEVFLSKLSAYCDKTPGSSWEVLAQLDQYHRRGKLSADHFRAFRRKIEFHALGIIEPPVVAARTQPVMDVAETKAEVEAEVATPAATVNDEEFQALRAALEAERERSQRYKHRIATLSEFGRQHRSISRSRAPHVVPQSAPAPVRATAPAPSMKLISASAKVSTSAKVRARRGKALVSLWLAQHRRLQHPRTWSYAAVLLAAATVIASSSSNVGRISGAPIDATTPVVFEPAPQLPAGFLEPRTISLSSEKFVVKPGSSVATVQVERTGEIGDVVQFKWRTQSAGAKSGQDYVGQSQVAQFEAGQTSVQLPVRILANPQRKHTEMFYVVLAEPEGEAALGENTRAAVFIMRRD